MFHQVISIICTEHSRNLLPSLEGWIAHNSIKPRLIPLTSKDFRKLQRPMERLSSRQQLVHLTTHPHERFTCRTPTHLRITPVVCLFVVFDQHGIFHAECTLDGYTTFGVKERHTYQQISTELDDGHSFIGLFKQPLLGFDIAHIVLGEHSNLSAQLESSSQSTPYRVTKPHHLCHLTGFSIHRPVEELALVDAKQ